MKVEFIVDKSEYQKLLSKDKFDSKINYTNKKVKGKNNFVLTLSAEGKNVATAKILSDSRITVETLFTENNVKYRLLTEEASQFFALRLYPYAVEFETKLRKFIYTALFDLDDKANELATKIYNSTMGVKKENKLNSLPDYDFLSEKEMHEIFDFLFANDEFLSQVKSLSSTNNTSQRHKTKNELLEEINSMSDTSIWAQIFQPFFGDSILPEVYNQIQKYRNDVMHFHNIGYKDYISIHQLFRKAIKDLDKQISKGVVIEDTTSNTSVLASCFIFLIAFIAKMNVIKSQFISELRPVLETHTKIQEQLSENLSKIRVQQTIIQEQLRKISVPNAQIRKEISELTKTYNRIILPDIKADPIKDEIKILSENLRKLTIQPIGDKKDGK